MKQDVDKLFMLFEFTNYEYITYKTYFNLIKELRRQTETSVFCPNLITVLKAWLALLFKSTTIYFWVQGIVPEESFMRRKSIIRLKVLSILEKLALEFANKHILVSQSMHQFYKEKYKLDIKDYIVVPCRSEFVIKNVIRRENSFVYIGGISKWQKISWTVEIFRKIHEVFPNATLDIITLQLDEAKKIIKNSYGVIPEFIKIYSISDRTQIPDILSSFQFGFLLREENPINYVSSPIKFAEYLSCGVNVLCSMAIPHYTSLIQSYNCGICVPEDIYNTNIKNLKFNEGNSIELYKSYFSEKAAILNYKKIL